MFTSLRTKPARFAILATGVVIGGLGTATAVSAQTADEGAVDDPAVEADSSERGERGEGRHRGGKGCGRSLEAVAEVIGIEVDSLRAALDEGQSVAEVAEANNVDPDDVVDALIADADARLDEKVEAGRITEDEAAEKLAEKTERIEDRVAGIDAERRADEEATEGS